MAKAVVWFFALFGGLFRFLKVDRGQFLAILEIKLTLDERRSIRGIQGASGKKGRRGLLFSALFYAFIGLFIGLLPLFVESPLTAMTVVNSVVMTMVGMILVSDFTNVLIDTTDNAVLLPRPVSGRTILASRTAHIVSYLGILSLSLSACTLVTGMIAFDPLFPLLYLAMLACMLAFVIFAVYVFYLAAMHLFDMERFRDIILYFQIAMTVLIFAGYQVLPRLVEMQKIRSIRIDRMWWIYFYPPAWMAAPFDLLAGRSGGPQVILTALAVAVPLAGLFLVARVLAPGFGRALAALESTPSGRGGEGRRPSLPSLLARLVTRKREERAAFEFFWPLFTRDRSFKLATYPSMAIVLIIMAVFMVFSDGEGAGHALSVLPQTKKYILGLYFACGILPSAFVQMNFSDRYEGAWIFEALPFKRPGAILMGAFKVVFLRFAAPMFAAVAALTLAVWGGRVLPDVALAGCFFLLFSLVNRRIFGKGYPLSRPRTARQAQSQTARTMAVMAVLSLVGLLHWLLTRFPWGVPSALVPAALLAAAVYRNTARSGLKIPGNAAGKKT